MSSETGLATLKMRRSRLTGSWLGTEMHSELQDMLTLTIKAFTFYGVKVQLGISTGLK